MRLVLDTNELIFALNPSQDLSPKLLLKKLIDSFPKHTIHVSQTIMSETRRNLPAILFSELIRTTHEIITIEEDALVTFELGAKYESLGLKPADASIAAFTEWSGSEILISENRHFLSQSSNLPFRVLTAEKALKLIH